MPSTSEAAQPDKLALESRSPQPSICEPGGKGYVFPFEHEHAWNPILMGALYAAALIYLFLGVAIVADKFVAAIEQITSRKKRVRDRRTGKYVTIQVWNQTVANLTLMALGSSAPEILLSVVETIGGGFHAGQLGPSTIVGSAAFNLFCIIATCIMAVPSRELRRIEEHGVFIVTALFSLFAYMWLVFIVQLSSPGVVSVWEGLLTLLFFPVLTIISYGADVGWFSGGKARDTSREHLTDAMDFASPAQGLSAGAHCPIGFNAGGLGQVPVHMKFHGASAATSWAPAGPAFAPGISSFAPGGPAHVPGGGLSSAMPGMGGFVVSPSFGPDALRSAQHRAPPPDGPGMLSFPRETMEVAAGLGPQQIAVPVIRVGGAVGEVSCKYRTEGLSAVPGYDYVEAAGDITFGQGVSTGEIPMTVLPKRLGEHSDQFQLILEDIQGGAIFDPSCDGGDDRAIVTITILNMNDAIAGQCASMKLSRAIDGAVNMDALRLGGATWYTELVDAVSGPPLEDGAIPSGGDWVKYLLQLPWNVLFALLIPPPAYLGGWLCFVSALTFIGGLTAIVADFAELFGCVTGLGDAITAITIVALGTSMPDLFASMTSAAQDDTADASIVNVTGSNSVNVFLGIGLPWFLAAVYWHVNGPTDEWTLKYGAEFGAQYPGAAFVVKGGDLGFSVIVFTIAAMVALAILHVRRVKIGGELGGPRVPQVLSAVTLVLLWFFYCGLSIWKIRAAPASDSIAAQLGAIFIGICVLENVLLLTAGVVLLMGGGRSSRHVDLENQESGDGGKLYPQGPPPLPPPADVPHAAGGLQAHGSHLRSAAAAYDAGSCAHPADMSAGAPGPLSDAVARHGQHPCVARVPAVGGHAPSGGAAAGATVFGRPLDYYGPEPIARTARSRVSTADGVFARMALVCLATTRLRRGRSRVQLWPLSARRYCRLERAPSFYSIEDAVDDSGMPPPTQTRDDRPIRRSSKAAVAARGLVDVVAHLTSPWAEEPPSPRVAVVTHHEASGLLRP